MAEVASLGLGLRELLVTAALIVLVLGVLRYMRPATRWVGAINRRLGARSEHASGTPPDAGVIDMVREGDTCVSAKYKHLEKSDRGN